MVAQMVMPDFTRRFTTVMTCHIKSLVLSEICLLSGLSTATQEDASRLSSPTTTEAWRLAGELAPVCPSLATQDGCAWAPDNSSNIRWGQQLRMVNFISSQAVLWQDLRPGWEGSSASRNKLWQDQGRRGQHSSSAAPRCRYRSPGRLSARP